MLLGKVRTFEVYTKWCSKKKKKKKKKKNKKKKKKKKKEKEKERKFILNGRTQFVY